VKGLLETLRGERRARAFLLTYAQSALGNGAAIVALLVIAYEREPSPWAITLVLLAYDLPPGFLGPLAGALVDRVSRKWCVIFADVVRAGAFVGIAVVDGIEATVGFALLAGAATALYSPAALASLPSLVPRDRLAAVTSLYGGITDAGRTIGPALAAVAFPLVGASGVMAINGGTFVVSALVLSFIGFGAAVRDPGEPVEERNFLREVREGLRVASHGPLVRVVVITSTGVILFASMLNVAELPLAEELGIGASGFALLLTAQGIGVVIGSLSGAREGGLREYKARYAVAGAAVGMGLVAMAVLPWFAAALAAFAVFGIGNGLLVVHERLIFQVAIPERLMGRAFALLDALGAWAFALAYLIAGLTVSVLGTRGSIAVAAAGALGVALYAFVALARAPDPVLPEGAPAEVPATPVVLDRPGAEPVVRP
jgi:MFS family permease